MLLSAAVLCLATAMTMYGSVQTQHNPQNLSTMPPAVSGKLRVYVLPVGQGDGHVIQCPSGKLSIVDLGSHDGDGSNVWGSSHIRAFFGTQIENVYSVLITHNHVDHFNLIPEVLDPRTTRLGSLKYIYTSCTANQLQSSAARWITETKRRYSQLEMKTFNGGRPCGIDRNCDAMQLCPPGDGVDVTVIAANLGGCGRTVLNSDSVVFKLTFRGISTMFTGDFAGEALQTSLVNRHRGTDTLKVTVFKLSHHGSQTDDGNSWSFVNAHSPKAVFVSANPFKVLFAHPRCQVIDRIRGLLCKPASGVRTGTDYCGSQHAPSTSSLQRTYSCKRSAFWSSTTVTNNEYAVYTTRPDSSTINLIELWISGGSWNIENHFYGI